MVNSTSWLLKCWNWHSLVRKHRIRALKWGTMLIQIQGLNYKFWRAFISSEATTCMQKNDAGPTPLNKVLILSCVEAYSKNCHFTVFLMIKICQTHVFLKDYVHIHQMGSHFVGGYRLDFSLTEQETRLRPSFCNLLALSSPRLL